MTAKAMNDGFERAMRKHTQYLNGASGKGIGFGRDSARIDWVMATMICEKAAPILEKQRSAVCFCDGSRVAVAEVGKRVGNAAANHCIGTLEPESQANGKVVNASSPAFWSDVYERLVFEIVSRRVRGECYRYGGREFSLSVSAIANCVDARGAFSTGNLRRRNSHAR